MNGTAVGANAELTKEDLNDVLDKLWERRHELIKGTDFDTDITIARRWWQVALLSFLMCVAWGARHTV